MDRFMARNAERRLLPGWKSDKELGISSTWFIGKFCFDETYCVAEKQEKESEDRWGAKSAGREETIDALWDERSDEKEVERILDRYR